MKATKLIAALAITSVAVAMLTACKTTEKNYRKAYEKAIADNDRGVTDFENTIYSQYRNQARDIPTALNDSTTVNTRLIRVKVTDGGGGIPQWLNKYAVVVAEFKQRFNASSLRNRYVDAGYPRTFLVENPEPYYYIVASSSDNLADMVSLADSIRRDAPVPLKNGFPYILQVPGR